MFIEYDVQEVFSERLKTLMQEKNLNISQFALKIGIPDSTISDWLHKKRIPLIVQMPKIAFFFNVSNVSILIFYTV